MAQEICKDWIMSSDGHRSREFNSLYQLPEEIGERGAYCVGSRRAHCNLCVGSRIISYKEEVG